MAYVINDRRSSALGGQSRDRSRSAITTIGWHYSAVARSVRKFITGHEEYWKNTLGWDRGGYHFYIDAEANIWQNYDYERITWGVKDNNGYVVHISVEAGNGGDYSPEQVAARDWLTRKIMADLNISASDVKGHNEIYNNSSCPGYTKAQMDEFRAILAQPVDAVPAISNRMPVNYEATIMRGGYSIDSKPWGEPGFENWSNTTDWLYKTIHFREENATREYANGDYFGWVDKRALGKARKNARYTATVISAGFSIDSLPWGEEGYYQLGLTDNHVYSVVTVLMESLSGEYAYIRNDEKEIGWVDKRALIEGVVAKPKVAPLAPIVVKSVLHLPNGKEWVVYPSEGPYQAGDVISLEGEGGESAFTILGERNGGKVLIVELENFGIVSLRLDVDKGAKVEKIYG